jgi:hypothetical protein
MKRFKSPRHVQRFLSAQDQLANVFPRRRDHDTAANLRFGRSPRPSPPGPTSPASPWLHNYAYRRASLSPSRFPSICRSQVDGAPGGDAPFRDMRGSISGLAARLAELNARLEVQGGIRRCHENRKVPIERSKPAVMTTRH